MLIFKLGLILDTVRYGYKLFFKDNIPTSKDFRPNNKSALSKPTFLWEELVFLEQLGLVSDLLL